MENIKLTDRQKRLVSYLMKQKGYQTAKVYAAEFNVSERTIYSDLKKIENVLNFKGYELEKKSGVGIGLREKKTNHADTREIAELDKYTIYGRRKEIMNLLLFEKQNITIEALSEMFLVSKSSITNDLKFIEKKLTLRNKVQLVSDHKGTRLEGMEEEIQKVFFEFNQYIFEENELLLFDEEKSLDILSSYYGIDTVSVCSRVLFSYIKAEVGYISEQYIINVLNMMVILIYRMQKGYCLKKENDSVSLSGLSFTIHKSATDMLEKISIRLNFNYSLREVEYLSNVLISNKFEKVPSNEKTNLIVNKIIQKVGESISFDFEKDDKLQKQLSTHIPAMIYRLKLGVRTKNPFISQIKQEFRLVFDVIWVALSEYEETLGGRLNEDEIGFLALYFQSVIERSKVGKKILIVCPTGIATSELLLNRVKNILPSFDMLEVASAREVKNINLSEVDFIISTVDVEIKNKKVVVVSPLLNDQDMKNISETYNESFLLSSNMDKRLIKLPFLSKYIDDKFIFFDEDFESKEELFNKIGSELVNQNYITQEFINSMEHRETLGGTDLPTGAAIPHGNPKFVNKTVIAFIRNKRYFKWSQHPVKTILIACISQKDIGETKNIFSDIYNLVGDKEVLNEIYILPNKLSLKERIGNESSEHC